MDQPQSGAPPASPTPEGAAPQADPEGALANRGPLDERPRAEIEREKRALAVHRDALHGAALPRPKASPRGAFTHGFLLLFSLLIAALRDTSLRRPFLRAFAARLAVVALVGAFVFATAMRPKLAVERYKQAAAERGLTEREPEPVHLRGAGVQLDIEGEQAQLEIFGKKIDIKTEPPPEGPPLEGPPPEGPPPAEPSLFMRFEGAMKSGWLWIVALVAALSATEAVVVFLTRRYDDWLSFHASRLVGIRPEDAAPKEPVVALDVKWLIRKLRRRFRGYVVFVAGIPLLAPLHLLPAVGPWIFRLGLTLWGWYWLGVFTAAKSAHAWIDEGKVGSPALIRGFNRGVGASPLTAPLRWYGRAWARLTRGVDPPASTFERAPAAFLGLALARACMALPGFYLLVRSLVPVAAGRLCAESDPDDRFSITPSPPSAPPAPEAPAAPAAPSAPAA